MTTQKAIGLILSLLVLGSVMGQDRRGLYKNPPIVITIEFQSFSMPFKQLKSNFQNIGIGIGTEFSHSGNDQDWAQAFRLVWSRNKSMGNGIALYTQTVARPKITNDFFGEVRLGLGYQYLYRPSESLRFENGKWVPAGKKGGGMLMIPVNAGFGYLERSRSGAVATSVNYQFKLLKGYNRSIPIVPMTTVIGGIRIHNKD